MEEGSLEGEWEPLELWIPTVWACEQSFLDPAEVEILHHFTRNKQKEKIDLTF